jgi:hypothetical protein
MANACTVIYGEGHSVVLASDVFPGLPDLLDIRYPEG